MKPYDTSFIEQNMMKFGKKGYFCVDKTLLCDRKMMILLVFTRKKLYVLIKLYGTKFRYCASLKLYHSILLEIIELHFYFFSRHQHLSPFLKCWYSKLSVQRFWFLNCWININRSENFSRHFSSYLLFLVDKCLRFKMHSPEV